MNVKKAILASIIVSSMLVTVAGPIPAGAEAAQEQQQSDSKKVQIDKTMAAKLQKAVKQFAGKEIKLQDVGESTSAEIAKVTSIDGKYIVHFDYKKGEVWSIDGTVPLDKISKEAQEEVLKALKEAYAKKTYVLDKEVVLTKPYDGKKEKLKDYFSYTLTGKDFEAIWSGTGFVREVTIKLAKEELDSKWLETATKAMKTAFDHDLNVTAAYLVSVGENYYMLSLKDNDVSLEMEAKKGKVLNVYHKTRKKVTNDQEITEKDAKEVVAPLAKELFNIDIAGYEVKWDNTLKDYCFVKGKETVVRAALDADKNAVYIISGG
ncbi:hypothetical protein [Paenibacillus apiarius]|uniref:PepSY domain-containing protein n=1 Tax=Paenibacillus apiarius TaxID=46240 RepID=A0ABT4DX34_9BACL|nr:hypothetical protein [Paenibacillus apiarius]MCY9517410.1 hypothetical protein [Paenibacillus apiarius]MCY9520633.1 hypothetical protein [Paenibacillus apiarius]MCY9552975.1 hypothetical protein [Paenibacillus apiarius]MCY9561658.1 hypothetical protein [Paenibacillus apiarius]MCY9687063.1 hypothetical protein [Paenibacillus apiarius]